MEEWRLIVPSITEHAGEAFVEAMNDRCCNLVAVLKNTMNSITIERVMAESGIPEGGLNGLCLILRTADNPYIFKKPPRSAKAQVLGREATVEGDQEDEMKKGSRGGFKTELTEVLREPRPALLEYDLPKHLYFFHGT
eukprot:1261390-Pleurochrysis_carterae.AAC.1